MKPHRVVIASVLMVLGLVWVTFAQTGDTKSKGAGGAKGERRGQGMSRENQQKALSAIEEQLTKLKSGMEAVPANRQNWQNLPEEERNALRAKFIKMREERQQSIALIGEQLEKLTGRRALTQEHEKSISELNTIRELAVKEKATETAASIDKLVAAKKKAFEERLQKLGLQQGARAAGN